MRPALRSIAISAGALLLISAAPATADTQIETAPGARNLTQGGGWMAWAEPTGDRWRLVARSPAGAIVRPAIPNFGAPPDPAIGSNQYPINGRRILAVYSRCAAKSPVDSCDLWALDLAAGRERKLKAASSPSCSETAPSIYSGGLAFVRSGGACASKGVFRQRGDGAARRVSSRLARETAVNGSRIAYVHDSGAGWGVTVRRLSGDGVPLLLATNLKQQPRSLVYGRYTAAWLLAVDEGMAVFLSSRISGNKLVGRPVRHGRRLLPASTDSIAAEDGKPRRYLDSGGIKTIDPSLF